MKRKVIDGLMNWNLNPEYKPVLLTGAKGVGKTYLAYDFAKSFYEHILYLNLERRPAAHELFHNQNPQETTRKLLKYFDLSEGTEVSGRLLILDEIAFCPEVYTYLASIRDRESSEFPRIIAITSLPLIEAQQSIFHVLPVVPLEFDEFLLATANDWYVEAIQTHFEANKPLPEIVHKELLVLHDLYMMIGGMPGTVNEYLNFNSLSNIAEQHSFLIGSYHDYILRLYQDNDALKMNQVYDSLTLQLMKPNKKFQYKQIRKGTTHAMYREAIQKLKDCNYILQCNKITSEQLRIGNSSDQETTLEGDAGANFKLYLPDTGLLYTRLTEESYLPKDPIVRKALLENYVAQAFHAKGYPLMFWESDSMAKIEFILPREDDILPVEVHIDKHTRSKSISVLKQKQPFPYAVKISSKNFEYSNQVKYVPYYAVFCL